MTTLLETPPSLADDQLFPGSRPEPVRYRKVAPGSAAEDELVREYMPLVKTSVGRIAMTLPSHVEIQDLSSAGMVGLLNAVRQFDPEAGSTFESYARVRIRGAIFDELRRLDWTPRSVHGKAHKVEAVIRKLEQEVGGVPPKDAVAKALNLSLHDYEQLLEEIKPATFVCLDSAPSSEQEAECSRYDSIPDASQPNPFDVTAQRELTSIILKRLGQLPGMQRKVLALYYFEDLRLREIAEVFGVTESRICQVHAEALLNIRSYLRRSEAACR